MSVTDDRQTDGRWHIADVKTFAKNLDCSVDSSMEWSTILKAELRSSSVSATT